MQQAASPAPSPASSTFAGLMAALSARPFGGVEPLPAWKDDGLADDVATLSYERALRAHARYRAPDLDDRALTQAGDAGSVRLFEALPANADSPAPTVEPHAPPTASAAKDRNLKCASITIRLSRAECDQLRQRAAEAGLTVSAYLRSCTFEAERLRALVKDTLAELRSEPAKASAAQPLPNRRSWRLWLCRLRPHSRPGQPLEKG